MMMMMMVMMMVMMTTTGIRMMRTEMAMMIMMVMTTGMAMIMTVMIDDDCQSNDLYARLHLLVLEADEDVGGGMQRPAPDYPQLGEVQHEEGRSWTAGCSGLWCSRARQRPASSRSFTIASRDEVEARSSTKRNQNNHPSLSVRLSLSLYVAVSLPLSPSVSLYLSLPRCNDDHGNGAWEGEEGVVASTCNAKARSCSNSINSTAVL